jgi:hypothetical protein
MRQALALAVDERQFVRRGASGTSYICVGEFLHKYPILEAPDIWTFADGFAKLSRQEPDLEKPG